MAAVVPITFDLHYVERLNFALRFFSSTVECVCALFSSCLMRGLIILKMQESRVLKPLEYEREINTFLDTSRIFLLLKIRCEKKIKRFKNLNTSKLRYFCDLVFTDRGSAHDLKLKKMLVKRS